MRMLGSTKLRNRLTMTLVKEAAQALDARDGDYIIFYEEGGKVQIKKG